MSLMEVKKHMNISKADIEHCKNAAKTDVYKFYKWNKWYRVREKVLKMDKYECQRCKKMHRYSPAQTVHHVYEFKKYPEYGLSVFVENENGVKVRNLISLCNTCHNLIHNRFNTHPDYTKKVVTEERWD